MGSHECLQIVGIPAFRAVNLLAGKNNVFGANTDSGDFITWIAKVTGHKTKKK